MKKQLHRAALLSLVAVLALAFTSCGGGKSKYTQDAAGFEKLGGDLQSKFGADAYYTNLGIVNDSNGGFVINLTVTKDPSSLKMEEWVMSAGSWRQTADVTLQVEGADPADFMFQLGKDVDMKKFGTMVEEAKAKVTEVANIEGLKLNLATVNTPDDEDKSGLRYMIDIKPEHGGTSFYFNYDAQGELISFDY
ncbi:hypothetical protein LJC45_02205 [Alistipes sp. OttesenSCG-928-B03]|nr:hypothetical protein [Alistipes sp. OttesenSCG-928-B03]